jgi:hypothetical protein
MIRSFLLVQVDGSKTVMRNKQVVAVLFTDALADRDGQVLQCIRYLESPVPEA